MAALGTNARDQQSAVCQRCQQSNQHHGHQDQHGSTTIIVAGRKRDCYMSFHSRNSQWRMSEIPEEHQKAPTVFLFNSLPTFTRSSTDYEIRQYDSYLKTIVRDPPSGSNVTRKVDAIWQDKRVTPISPLVTIRATQMTAGRAGNRQRCDDLP